MNKTDVYQKKSDIRRTSYKPRIKGDLGQVEKAVEALAQAKRPIIYAGGGVINAGPEASQLLEIGRAHV